MDSGLAANFWEHDAVKHIYIYLKNTLSCSTAKGFMLQFVENEIPDLSYAGIGDVNVL